MRAVILCGGKGTRAYPLTADVPKPMLEVAGQPVVAWVMDVYARAGIQDFVLAAGYRADVVTQWAALLETRRPAWNVTVRDTGVETGTGGRVLACRELLDRAFCLTYGDGVGDVDIAALLETHRVLGAEATVTTVPLPSQYGTLDLDGSGFVRGFREKPVLRDHWINAGFFVMEPSVFDDWGGDDLERDVLPRLAARGQLAAYRHEGFWKSMDTQKDQQELDRVLRSRTRLD